MKTIKIRDLLKKLLNGEEMPKKIKTSDCTFFYLISDYLDINVNFAYIDEYDNYWLDNLKLNDEVEIIEEDKKIEKIIYDKDTTYEWALGEVYDKINELIDEVNKLKEDK